jgi:CcmD family protein
MRHNGLFFALVGLTLLVAGWAMAQETVAPAEAPKEAVISEPVTAVETPPTPEAPATKPEAKPSDTPKAAVGEVDSGQKEASGDGGTAFVAMDPSQSQHREALPAFPFLYSAYVIIWLGLFLYLISLGRRQRALDEKIAELSALVSQRSSGD